MATIAQVSHAMQTVLTTVADTAARTTGFVQRVSKCTGALFTQTLVRGFLSNPQASREELAQTAATLGRTISQQGRDQRMTEAGAACLLAVLEAATTTVLAADPVAIPLLARFTGVCIQDSTVIGLPRTLAHIWRGSGNQHTADTATARLKLGVRLELATGALTGPDPDHGVTSDRTISLQDDPIPAGALRIADLGFFDLDVLQAIEQATGFWLTRPQITTVLTDQDGQRRDLPTVLAAQTTASVAVPIRLGARHHLPCRLLALRVPQEVADQRGRRLRAEAKRRGRAPNARHLALAGWTIFVTNVPSAQLTLAEARILGRCRWHSELRFKLWKSHGQIDQWRSAKGGAIRCELYAKVIAMILHHWIMLVSCWAYADRSLTKAAATVRRHALGLAIALRYDHLDATIAVIVECLQTGCRINKRRKTPHTYQLLLDATEAVVG